MQSIQPLNEWLNDSSIKKEGSHILYMYSEVEKYMNQALHYIYDGLTKQEFVLFIEDEDVIENMLKHLKATKIPTSYLDNLICIVSSEFYLSGEDFNAIGAANKLTELLKPLLNQHYTVRTWGKVPLLNNELAMNRVRTYECNCNAFIKTENMISVCTYNALITPSFIQNELLKTHTYLITDDTYTISPLYNQHNKLKPSPLEEMQNLVHMKKKYKDLKVKNSRLEFETRLVKLRSDVIKQSEQKLRTIIDELPMPIFIRKNNHILFFNKKHMNN